MGFNSGFKGLMNVLYVNKQEFSALSWRSNQGYNKMHCQPTIQMYSLVPNNGLELNIPFIMLYGSSCDVEECNIISYF